MTLNKKYYFALVAGAAVGLCSSLLQTIEKIKLIENKNAALPCDIGDVFSCSAVLSAPQSSLFGFPNSLVCFFIFSVFFTVGVMGVAGSRVPKKLGYALQILASATLMFALWFILFSTFVIEAVCIFCLVCFVGLAVINGVLWRINFSSSSPNSRIKNALFNVADKNFDILTLFTLCIMLAAAIVSKFYTG